MNKNVHSTLLAVSNKTNCLLILHLVILGFVRLLLGSLSTCYRQMRQQKDVSWRGTSEQVGNRTFCCFIFFLSLTFYRQLACFGGNYSGTWLIGTPKDMAWCPYYPGVQIKWAVRKFVTDMHLIYWRLKKAKKARVGTMTAEKKLRKRKLSSRRRITSIKAGNTKWSNTGRRTGGLIKIKQI